jgi:hypothetical protein
MRTKTRSAEQLRPGMVARLNMGATGEFRQISHVGHGPWGNTRTIRFTDGTGQWHHRTESFLVARGKTVRNIAIRRAGIGSTVDIVDAVAALFRVYALAAYRISSKTAKDGEVVWDRKTSGHKRVGDVFRDMVNKPERKDGEIVWDSVRHVGGALRFG